jgi:hypothetical protein
MNTKVIKKRGKLRINKEVEYVRAVKAAHEHIKRKRGK